MYPYLQSPALSAKHHRSYPNDQHLPILLPRKLQAHSMGTARLDKFCHLLPIHADGVDTQFDAGGDAYRRRIRFVGRGMEREGE